MGDQVLAVFASKVAAESEKRQAKISSLLEELYSVMVQNVALREQKEKISTKTKLFFQNIMEQ